MSWKIKKYCAAFILVFLASSPVLRAQYSNDWISFGQPYYKIPVAKSGIYRLTYNDLQAAGIPLSSIDPRRINLFHRGVEQAIFIQGESDASFDPPDYLEFYGARNDGTLDKDLYKSPNLQPHTYYNLYSDTTAYFLTWNPLPVQGRRMSSYTESQGSLSKEVSQVSEQLVINKSEYSGGYTELDEIQDSAFDEGEGWTGATICTNLLSCTGQLDYTITGLTNGVTLAGTPALEVLLVGREAVPHQAEISAGAGASSLRIITNSNFVNYQTSKVTVPINWTDIAPDGSMTVRVRIVPSGTKDLLSVSYVRVTLPQDFNMSSAPEKYMTLASNSGNKSYIEIQNPPTGVRLWDITDPDAPSVYGTYSVTGGVGAVILNTSTPRKLYAGSTVMTPSLKPVKFRSISPSLHNYIIISHRSLMKPALGYADAVQAYAAYRASKPGGGYDTLTIAMNQLYDQFDYGETSPRAIFQFMKFMVNGGNPKYLFLIGKGLDVSLGFYRNTSLAPTDFRDLVPTAGTPGSDMIYTAGLKGTRYEPAVATGRLTASTPTQVAAYLNKVKEMDAVPFTELWRKDLLHLSGGIKAGEPEKFRAYVDSYKTIAEGFYLGAQVQTVSKQSLNVELINVKDQVNKGLNLITFFGHSGPGTIDIDIGYVSDPTLGYNNAGKYPAFLINGCNAGRFFDNRVNFGEDWMLTASKGARGFIAHSSFGFDEYLNLYSNLFYQVAYTDSSFLRKGIGDVQKETGRRYQDAASPSLTMVTQIQQMVLLGDPAVALFPAPAADYQISNGSLSVTSLDDKPVTAQSPSFAINFTVSNPGRAMPVSMKVRVVRTLSDNSTITYDSVYSPVYYQTALQMIIRKGRSGNEAGSNNFTVTVNSDQAIPEISYANNSASLNFFVPLNGTKHIYPVPYSIVNKSSVSLSYQNTDLLGASRGYLVEVDTAATFDSPYLARTTVTAPVYGSTSIQLLSTDSLVYYWRTRFEKPAATESSQWTTSSFTYIQNGNEGWAQMKFPQLKEDVLTGLQADSILRKLVFASTKSTVEVLTYGSANPAPYTQVSLKINGDEQNVASQGQSCRNNTLNMIAFDRSSSAPYAGLTFSFFDPRDCGRAPQMINSFTTSELDAGNNQDITAWVANIKASDSVVLFSIGDAGYATWSANVLTQLSLLGVGTNQLSTLQPGEPFVIFGKKGGPVGTAKVYRPSSAPVNAQQVHVNKTVTGRFSTGNLTSVLIGPATNWSQLSFLIRGVGPNDVYGVDVIGVDLKGNESVLKTGLTSGVTLTDVPTGSYPYLKLRLNTADDIDQNPVQLIRWIVLYTPVAEGSIIYNGAREPASLQEGQTWEAVYGFVNISTRTFSDSLTVQQTVYNASQHRNGRWQWKIKAPLPRDTTWFKASLLTKGWSGINDVTLEVNPRILPEQYYDNNAITLFSYLNVQADRTPPILDVTVDGRRVLNGDMVGPTPLILARIIDQNRFMPKVDTVGINLFVGVGCKPDSCNFRRVTFKDPALKWSPATPTSDFTLQYRPTWSPGSYTLRVEAVDGSGNSSGSMPYEVTMVVSKDPAFTVRNVYPNPAIDGFYLDLFSAGTDELQDFRLDVYSSTGSLVRRIGNEMLTSLHAGTNTLWLPAVDAQDNPLPTGIYLFRMTGFLGGKEFVSTGRLVVVR
ncbi:MAG: hypothetical protein JST46_11675 [Bacteroidetes bacterium]|nr:hypothetical protein [Bacteroidota bacterium]